MSSVSFASVCVQLLCWQRKTFFCGSSLPFTRNATSNLVVLRCCPFHLGLVGALVRLAPGFSHCTASNLYPVASPGVLPVLAQEIQAWTPPIPPDLQALIRRMARENPSWGEERIANELLLKLGLRVSPRTIRKYLPRRLNPGRGKRATPQRWRTFVHNHAQAIVACDFCVVVTATFRLLYVFVLMEHATRRILHINVTAHPTAPWTLQQLREAIPSDHNYRFLIHDRDSIFSAQLDQQVRNLGLKVLKTPVRSPQANALCERLLGTLRRECLDYLIPLSENHVRWILQAWVLHYNAGRPHMSLGPGIPQPPSHLPVALHLHRHQLPQHLKVVARPILGGLHHEYGLAEKAV